MKLKIITYISIIIVYILITFDSYAQLNVSTGNTANYYVQNVLLGSGVSVSNITFTGNSEQIGEFSNGNTTTLGLDRGIVLSTGNVTNIPQSGGSQASTDEGTPGDNQLNSLAGATTNDAAILEFDFYTEANHVEFRYVFGSEEYPEFVNSGYNDAFAFFISGPNPNGGTYSSYNIALIPGTSTPVTIDNVNDYTNSQYYIDNGNSSTIVLDGLTTVLVAQADIVPCQTYHIKIAIADAGDHIYDSAVFLEANSFNASGGGWDLSYTNSNFNVAVENCVDALAVFHRENSTNDTSFSVIIGGSATNGVDYETISTNVFIPAGQDSFVFNIHPYPDGVTEGEEDVQIIYETGCGLYDTISIPILDELTVDASFSASNTDICEGDTVTFTYTGPNAADTGVSFFWSFGANSTIISGSEAGPYQVAYNTAGDYSAQLLLLGVCDTDITSIPIHVHAIPTSSFVIQDSVICSGNSTTITYTGTGDNNDTFQWNFGPTATILSGNGQGPYELTWNNMGNNTVSLVVLGDGICPSDTTTGTVQIVPTPSPNADSNTSVCGYTYHLQGTLSSQNSICDWSTAVTPPNGSASFLDPNNPTTFVNVSINGTYQFVLHEYDTTLNCDNYDTIAITFIIPPDAPFTIDTVNCYGDSTVVQYTGVTGANSEFHWTFYGGDAPTTEGPGPIPVIWNTPGVHTVSLWVDNNGCYSDTNIQHLYVPYPLQLSLTVVSPSCHGSGNGYIASHISGGRPPFHYEWNNGSHNASIYNLTTGYYYLTVTDQGECSATASGYIEEPPPFILSVPENIWGCNHDTLTINIAATGGTYPYQFHWNTGDSTQTINVIVNGETQYSVYATDANGCQTSTQTINVHTPDTLRIKATPETDSICPGEAVPINTTITGGLSPYNVYLNNVPTYPPIIVYPTSLSHTYTITVNDVCGTTASDTVNIGVFPVPVLSFSSDTTSGCPPLTVTFNNNSANPYYQAQWIFSDSTGYFDGDRITHTFKNPGHYDVTLTVTTDKGCKTSITSNDFIEVFENPIAEFSVKPTTVTIITPEVLFINESQNNIFSHWSFGDGDSSLAENPSHSYQDTGLYEVSLYVESDKGCKDTARYLLKVNDIFTFYAPEAFTPDNDGVNEYFQVFGHNINEKTYTLTIYDRWGEIIWQGHSLKDKWDGKAKGDKKIKPGTYIWHTEFYDLLGKYHELTGKVIVIY